VIESPDRSPQDLKTIEDWVLERAYKSVPGVADDSGFGGTVMQYQVLLDPARLYGLSPHRSAGDSALSANNSNAGGGFYSQGGQFYYVRGLGLVRDTKDIGTSSWPARTARPCGQRHGRGGDRPRAAPGRVRLPGRTTTPSKASS
jgi:Cu/Ag efflux pump CusA